MRIEVRPVAAVTVLFLVVLVVVAGPAVMASVTDSGEPERDIPGVTTVELEDGSEVWPYTSRSQNFGDRTLALNLVVYGNTSLTEWALRTDAHTDAEWRDVEDDEYDMGPGDEDGNQSSIVPDDIQGGAGLGEADGAVRWTYVETPSGETHWLRESYQLKDGSYLGQRDHLRAYEDPENDNWTVFQAHSEHWDWFQIRHTVHSIEETQATVELEFVDHPIVEGVIRDRWGNDRSSDSNGWATVVTLNDGMAPLLLGGLIFASVHTLRWRQLHQNEEVRTLTQSVVAAGSIVAVFAFVRFGAVRAEYAFPDVHIHLVAATFYPILVFGLPVSAYLTARQLDRRHAFTAVFVGFIVAMLIDYTSVGVTAVSLEAFLHRATLAVALGFIAAGASRTAREPNRKPGYVRTGVLLWLVALVIPLLHLVPFL